MKHILLITLFCLFLVVAPVSAQQATPAPDEVERLITLVTQLLQKQSSTDASTVNTSVVILGLGMLGVIMLQLLGVRSLTKPFLNFVESNQKERDEALEERKAAIRREDEAHEALMQRIEADAEKDKSSTRLEIQRTGSIQQLAGATQKIVDDIETKVQSEERGHREVGEINKHFDETVQPLNQGLEGIKSDLKDIVNKLDRVATRENLNEIVEPIALELRGVVQHVGDLEGVIREMIETGQHPAVQPTPETPSST